MKPLTFRVPKMFDRDALPPGVDADAAAYFINLVAVRHLLGADEDRRGIARLKAVYLRNVDPNYLATIAALERQEVVVTDRHFVPGLHSRGYSITAAARASGWRYDPCEDLKLAARVHRHRRPGERATLKVHRGILADLDRVTLDLDHAEHIASECEIEHDRLMDAVGMFEPGGPRVFAYGPTGRVFTAVTAAKRELRRALRIDGEPTVELDVSNAQPLLLGAASVSRLRGLAFKSLDEVRSRPYLDGLALLRVPDEVPPDVRDWLDVCGRGGWVDTLRDLAGQHELRFREAGKSLVGSQDVERSTLKLRGLTMLFGLPDRGGKLWAAVASRFPTVAAFIESLKRGTYEQAARVAQFLESTVMVGGVVARLQSRGVPVLPIHDGLLVRERDSFEAYCVAKTVFNTELNLPVRLREPKPSALPARRTA